MWAARPDLGAHTVEVPVGEHAVPVLALGNLREVNAAMERQETLPAIDRAVATAAASRSERRDTHAVRRRPELVIFDCDGVLVDSEPISNDILATMLTAAGLEISPSECRSSFQGKLLADVVAGAEQRLGGPLPPGFLDRYEHDRAVAFRDRLRPVLGAVGAVRAIKAAGVAVCVASQGALSKTELTLGLTGLLPLIGNDVLFSAYSVPRGKPFPDLFLTAAEVMGARPDDCVVVEDTPSGVRAALAAGMRALGYVGDADEQALRDAGAEPLRSLAELPGHLQLA